MKNEMESEKENDTLTVYRRLDLWNKIWTKKCTNKKIFKWRESYFNL